MTSPANTDFNMRARTTAHVDALQITPREIADRLSRVLGKQVLAVITGKEVRSIQRWVAGDSKPSAADEKRLRDAYQVYSLLASVEGDHTIRAWFVGMNPQLEDEAPAEALAAGNERSVMVAARAFVNGG